MKNKHREHEVNGGKGNTKHTDNKENTVTNGSPEAVYSKVGYETAEKVKGNEDDINSAKPIVEVRALEEKLAEMQDRYIRLSAEFDNYRKRTLREKMDLSKYAGEDLLVKLLPIMDDFDRAVKHIDAASDTAAIKDGIDLIYTKFGEFLKQNGIKEIESLNESFNVDLHEAIAKVAVDDDKKGKVIDVIQKGYYLQDKVLRFSKVVVGE